MTDHEKLEVISQIIMEIKNHANSAGVVEEWQSAINAITLLSCAALNTYFYQTSPETENKK